VAKYCSLGSTTEQAARGRRAGLPAAAIKQVVSVANFRANHDGGHGQEQVERFRASLISLPRHEQINWYLGLFGSHERALPLWEATLGEPATVFWRVFLRNWWVCDGIWPLRRLMLSTLCQRAGELSPIEFMEEPDRQFYDRLPSQMPVYRGCGRRRVRSLPWTTDRVVADKFARGGRFPQPPDPVIACAEIAKANLLFVSANRQENEVVLDPYSIKNLRLEPL
jgi:hypothetical protein